MPTKPKHSKPEKETKEEREVDIGSIHEELEVPVSSEVVFRKIWTIRKFTKSISKRDFVDSPEFRCSVNGVGTFWNISIRFWKGPNGKKVTNPVVVCLNLTGCETEETGQARVRFQFGVWDASIKHWECCAISNVVLNLENKKNLLSVGYKSLGILDRHMDQSKDVKIMVKLQIIHSDEEVHSLSRDMARLMDKDSIEKDTLIECENDNEENGTNSITVHSWIIRMRSAKLGSKLLEYKNEKNKHIKYKLDFSCYSHNLIYELVRYIYTDKVDNAETYASHLLPLSTKYKMPGLTGLCERTLLETLTPGNVASILLLADENGCENLRKAALHYCEESEEIKGCIHTGKTLAWRVMEMVNPDLFLEACESIGSSSSNIDSTGSWSE
ncbi:speckle-type POZ protein B-like isoform X2 [Coccinella septempunctata]|nr:speckle-type POZ protein B-like isoform X2 [Coccinella septempunctata]